MTNYIISFIVATVVLVTTCFMLPEDVYYLSWFSYLLTYFGVFIGMTLEDIRDGIRK